MTGSPKELNIKMAAKILGVHQDTIKYWEEKNLIPPARRNPKNKYRVYNLDEIKEIARIRGIYEVEVDAAINKLLRQ